MDKNKKSISITCDGQVYLGMDELVELQGELKSLSDEAYSRLKRSVLRFGFSFPVFYVELDGKNYILDAHQRIRTLKRMMSEDGYTIGKLPCSRIHAKDKIEAKEKLLALNSGYGRMETEGLHDFLKEDNIDIESIEDYFNPTEFDIEDYKIEFEFDDLMEEEEVVADDSGKNDNSEEKKSNIDNDYKFVGKIKKGDVITIGKSIVVCGSGLNAINKVSKGKIADIAVINAFVDNDYSLLDSDIFLKKWVVVSSRWQFLGRWMNHGTEALGEPVSLLVWEKSNLKDFSGQFALNMETSLLFGAGCKLRAGMQPKALIQASNKAEYQEFVLNALPDGSILSINGGVDDILITAFNTDRECQLVEANPETLERAIHNLLSYTGETEIIVNKKKMKWSEYGGKKG